MVATESGFVRRVYLEDVIIMSEQENHESSEIYKNTGPKEKPKDLRLLGALVRTAFASERTLMSWMRTSVSLLTFGFSIAKFFHYLEEQQGGTELSVGPKRLGLALICLGVLALVMAMIEHAHRLLKMQEKGLPKISQYLLPLGTAALFVVIGIVASFSVLFDWSF